MNAERDGVVYYCRRPKEADWNEHEAAMHMLKQGFWEFFQMEFQEEDVSKREDGKPCYAAKPNLKFNISHCREGIAVVLSDREVGIDAESMRNVNRRVVKKCCSREEMEYVFGRGADDLKEIKKAEEDALEDVEKKRFLRLWTLKESYVKMTGEGLRVSFDRVCFFPWDLENIGEKEVKEIKGPHRGCRHYACSFGGLMLALTVQWREEREPDFVWKEVNGHRFL